MLVRAFEVLQSWLSKPFLDPLSQGQNIVQDLISTHDDSVSGFANIMNRLIESDGSVTEALPALSGEGADAMITEIEAYLNLEALFAGPVTQITTGALTVPATQEAPTVLEEMVEVGEQCSGEIETAIGEAAAEIGEDAGLEEVTTVVDAAALGEGGANPIADAAAIILTIVVGAMILKTLYDLGWAIYDAVKKWQNAMSQANKPLPGLPSLGTTVPYVPPTTRPSITLTPEEEELFEKLKQDYPDAPDELLKELIDHYGTDDKAVKKIRLLLKRFQAATRGLTPEQIQQLLQEASLDFIIAVLNKKLDPETKQGLFLQFLQYVNDYPNVPSDLIAHLMLLNLTGPQIQEVLENYAAIAPPPVTLTAEQQAIYDELREEFPDVDPYLLAKLVQVNSQIDKIRTLLTLHKGDLDTILALYTQLANIPGVDQILKDMVSGGTLYDGALSLATWAVAHKGDIRELEATASGQRSVDVILKDGTVIDFKAYKWYKPGYNEKIDDIIEQRVKQAKRDQKDYPGKQVVFMFDSNGLDKNDMASFNLLKAALEAIGVKVETWPDATPEGVK